MKILLLILGLVFAVIGIGLTIHSWSEASGQGRIEQGFAYSGPFLIVVGAWRIFSSASVITPPAALRIVAVALGIGAGYGNTAAIKATYPAAQEISVSNNR